MSDNERTLLGALLRFPDRVPLALGVIDPLKLEDKTCVSAYVALAKLAKAGQPTTPAAVRALLLSAGKPYAQAAAGRLDEWQVLAHDAQAGDVEALAGAVRVEARRRSLRAVMDRLGALAGQSSCDPDEWLTAAQEALREVGRSEGGGWASTLDSGEAFWQAIEAGQSSRVVPTGLRALDKALSGGFRDGELVVVGARPSLGKAQPVDAPVLTPSGWTTMGALSVGDAVIGADGHPVRVLGVYPQGVKQVYRVTMSDGASAECCEEHLWFTQTRSESRRGFAGSVRSLREIAETLHVKGEPHRKNHRVPVVSPVHFKKGEKLPLHPYLLGLLLGDGDFTSNTIRFSKPEIDVQERLARHLPDGDVASIRPDEITVAICRSKRGRERSHTSMALESLGLLGKDSLTKFIPECYLRASVEDRLNLLRGLADSDGYVIAQRLEISFSSRALRDGLLDLVRGLGGTATCEERIPRYTYRGETRVGSVSWRILSYLPEMVPVASRKHLSKWDSSRKKFFRSIDSIEPTRTAECVCIKVDSADSLYVTSDYVVTHNTAFVGGIAHAAGVAGHTVGFFSLEMPNLSIYSRLLSLESRIPLGAVKAAREGWAEEDVATALGTASQNLGRRPIYTQDKPATLDELRARATALRLHVGPLGLIVVDYLQLVREAPGQKSRTRENAVAEVSRELKMLAKELSCPLILLSQLNREVEKREDKRPRMSDLRETGSIEQDADIILFLHRDEYYERTVQNAGRAEVIVAKQRDGERDVRVPLRFDGPLARFHDAPEGEAVAQAPAPEPATPPARMTYDEDYGRFGGAVGDAE